LISTAPVVLEPAAFVTVRVIRYVAGVPKLGTLGLWSLEKNQLLPPFLMSQYQLVMPQLVEVDVSVTVTLTGALRELGVAV
jgi:hypothetical protein